MAEKKAAGYGRSWKTWLAIYVVAGLIAYLAIYFVFFADGGGGAGLYS